MVGRQEVRALDHTGERTGRAAVRTGRLAASSLRAPIATLFPQDGETGAETAGRGQPAAERRASNSSQRAKAEACSSSSRITRAFAAATTGAGSRW